MDFKEFGTPKFPYWDVTVIDSVSRNQVNLVCALGDLERICMCALKCGNEVCVSYADVQC